VSPDFPDHKPLFAVQEAIVRYLPRYLGKTQAPSPSTQPSETDIKRSLIAVQKLIRAARSAGAEITVIQHLDRQEFVSGQLQPGHDLIADTVRAESAPLVQLQQVLAKRDPTGSRLYRDEIHLSAEGQSVLADLMYQVVIDALSPVKDAVP
jgi:hypothetical protein